ncbi:IS110 family transposase [Parashewanella tropica]|uniref:IS110 family transposase n=1 Tax=Parashewanella tropica TaxID=2547970 RepID=UPI00105A6DCC|nr:IS110 family transposase [Parashewanella tropica]
MNTPHIIGIDLGKNSFHLVGHDQSGQRLFKKKLTRQKLLEFLAFHEPVIIAMESCGGSHWLARKCSEFGHTAKLIPPQYVKPYVKTNKNDFIDADAIAEAASRPTMRFSSPKTESAQVISTIQKIRNGYIRERTACMNRIGSILLEFGISLPKGHSIMKGLFQWLADKNQHLPPLIVFELTELHEHYLNLNERIASQANKVERILADNEQVKQLQSIPGIGPVVASACVSSVSEPSDFKNGRNFAAWIGLVPLQHSTGGKTILLGISKRGNKELRTLFIHGARSILWRDKSAEKYFGSWLINLKKRKPFNVAVVALANKIARIAWAVLVNKKSFEIRI